MKMHHCANLWSVRSDYIQAQDSPLGLKAEAQRAESRQRPGSQTVRPGADRQRRLLPIHWFKQKGLNSVVTVSREQLTSESIKDPWLCVCRCGSQIKASSILETRAPLQGQKHSVTAEFWSFFNCFIWLLLFFQTSVHLIFKLSHHKVKVFR